MQAVGARCGLAARTLKLSAATRPERLRGGGDRLFKVWEVAVGTVAYDRDAVGQLPS